MQDEEEHLVLQTLYTAYVIWKKQKIDDLQASLLPSVLMLAVIGAVVFGYTLEHIAFNVGQPHAFSVILFDIHSFFQPKPVAVGFRALSSLFCVFSA